MRKSNKIRESFIALGEQLSREANSVMNLWTWLPSYHSTGLAHEDYEYSFQPDHDVIIDEACKVLSELSNQTESDCAIKDEHLTDLYSCACGCGVVDVEYIEELFGRKAVEIIPEEER